MIETHEAILAPPSFDTYYGFEIDCNTSSAPVTLTAWYQDEPNEKYRIVITGTSSATYVLPSFNSDGTLASPQFSSSNVTSVDFITPTFIPMPTGVNTRNIVFNISSEAGQYIRFYLFTSNDSTIINGTYVNYNTNGANLNSNNILPPTYQIPWNPTQVMGYYQFAYRLKDDQLTTSVGKSLTVKTWYSSNPNDVYESTITIGDQSYSQAQTAVVFYHSNATGVPFSNENIAPSGYMHVLPALVSPTSMLVDHVGDPIIFEVTGDISYINGFNILMASSPSYSSYSDQILPDAISLTSVVPSLGGAGGTVTPPTDTPPTAYPDAVTTPYNTAVTISPAANDTAGTGALVPAQTYVIIGGNAVKLGTVAGGDITVNDNGTILFNPTNGYSGDVPFAYRVADTNGLTSDSTITVTVQTAPVPVGPTTHPDAVTTPYNTAVTVSPTANDEAGTGALVPSETRVVIDGIAVQSGSITGGNLTVNGDGTILFVPTDGFSGDAPFSYRVTDTNGLTSDSTVTITVQAAPVLTGPTARPDIFVTAFNKAITFSSTGNDSIGSAALVPSGTYIIDNALPVKSLTLTGGAVTVNPDGTIYFGPTDGFSGDVVFTYRITDVNGLTSDSTVTITVQAEVIAVAKPLAIRGAKWFLGNFETGELDAEPFSFSAYSGSLGIHRQEADVTIPLYGLTSSERADWKNRFEPGQKFAALIKGEEVVFAGPIAKRDPNFKDETIAIKAKGFKWWLETVFLKKEIGQSSVNSDTEKVTFKASPATVAKMIVQTSITGSGYPQSVSYPDSVPGDYVFEANLSELTSVSAALDKIFSDPLGVETTFRPKKVGNKIVWQLVAGNPHLNEDESTIEVDLNNENQVVDFSQIDDITDARNRWWLASDVSTGSNLQAKTAPGNNKLIREAKDKFSVTLTAEEMNAQYAARFEDSNTRYINTTLALWDKDLSLWNQTGRRFSIIGDAQSAGFSDTVRCIEVKFNNDSPVVQLTVDAIRRVYPTLPDRVDEALKWKNIDTSGSDIGSGWNPGDISTGDLSNADMWGDAGMPSMDGLPTSGDILEFSNFSHTTLSPRYPDGGLPVIHPATIVQGSGNRFFGMDKNRWILKGVVPSSSTASVRDIIGIENFTEKFYIRSAFLNNGNISQMVGAGSFGAEHVYETMAGMEFDGNGFGGVGSDYQQDQKAVSIEVIGAMFASITRVYFQIAVIATHIWEGHNTETGGRNYVPLKTTSQTSFWSAPVNTDGFITQDWSREINLPNNEFTFPAHMTKYGEKIAYTSAVVVPASVSIPVYYYGTSIPTELTPETVPETSIFNTLPIQQLPRVRIGEGGFGLWYSFPQTSLDSTSPKAIYGAAHGGWLYVIRAHKQTGPGIYRIRLTGDGVIPPDAIWVRAADLDWMNNPNIAYGLIVVPGYVVYSSEQGTSYRRIKADGSLGEEETVDADYGILSGYKGSNNSDYNFKNEYRAGWVGSAMPEMVSRPLSYMGYIYYFMSASQYDSTLHLYSVKTYSRQQ
jgi:hypothetical protein